MLFLPSLFLANAALSQPHAALCFTGVQISEFVFSCFTAGCLKGWEEKRQRNFYSYPTPRLAPSWSERAKLGKVRKNTLDLRQRQPVQHLSLHQSPMSWAELETNSAMAMENPTGICTIMTQLFKHYYLPWSHTKFSRLFKWRSHSFAFIYKKLPEKAKKYIPCSRVSDKCISYIKRWFFNLLYKSDVFSIFFFFSFCSNSVAAWELYYSHFIFLLNLIRIHLPLDNAISSLFSETAEHMLR